MKIVEILDMIASNGESFETPRDIQVLRLRKGKAEVELRKLILEMVEIDSNKVFKEIVKMVKAPENNADASTLEEIDYFKCRQLAKAIAEIRPIKLKEVK